MLQHLRTVLIATFALVALGTLHTLSTAFAPSATAAPAAMRTEPEQLSSAAVSSLAGASLRSVSIGF
jgi:hypothetical protein